MENVLVGCRRHLAFPRAQLFLGQVIHEDRAGPGICSVGDDDPVHDVAVAVSDHVAVDNVLGAVWRAPKARALLSIER